RTLMNTMKTIVALQEDFFKYGEALKPMILKDIAERIGMDISTISRVVNGKYVQTNFGVYELKYFFNEGLTTESGEEVSNRAIKDILQKLIDAEDKSQPLSDQALADALAKEGYKVARRTVSKYREQLNEPVARLRKQII
ncbi:MAG: RNA polymerase sigma-54 factor, partial [Bacteroidetes bacterium]|nr:RNA polymerase sigma-54 factor [Bacteroidota bacterium]